uniref:Uncharacterized protein n=1 Tax=Opuntia streptacantha TaxID=393608 RepID=A0A7C9CGY3_OPUST
MVDPTELPKLYTHKLPLLQQMATSFQVACLWIKHKELPQQRHLQHQLYQQVLKVVSSQLFPHVTSHKLLQAHLLPGSSLTMIHKTAGWSHELSFASEFP